MRRDRPRALTGAAGCDRTLVAACGRGGFRDVRRRGDVGQLARSLNLTEPIGIGVHGPRPPPTHIPTPRPARRPAASQMRRAAPGAVDLLLPAPVLPPVDDDQVPRIGRACGPRSAPSSARIRKPRMHCPPQSVNRALWNRIRSEIRAIARNCDPSVQVEVANPGPGVMEVVVAEGERNPGAVGPHTCNSSRSPTAGTDTGCRTSA